MWSVVGCAGDVAGAVTDPSSRHSCLGAESVVTETVVEQVIAAIARGDTLSATCPTTGRRGPYARAKRTS